MEEISKNNKEELLIAQNIFCSTSSDNKYITKIGYNFVSCTCPAGGRKQFCKHIRELVFDNLQQIKEKNIDFYYSIQEALEAQNSKILTQDEKKAIYSKVMKVDKGIAEAAYNNSISIHIPSDLDEWAEKNALKFIKSINRQINMHKEWVKMGFLDKNTYKNCINTILSAIEIVNEYDFKIDEVL